MKQFSVVLTSILSLAVAQGPGDLCFPNVSLCYTLLSFFKRADKANIR